MQAGLYKRTSANGLARQADWSSKESKAFVDKPTHGNRYYKKQKAVSW